MTKNPQNLVKGQYCLLKGYMAREKRFADLQCEKSQNVESRRMHEIQIHEVIIVVHQGRTCGDRSTFL
jgi:hypothetical protein